MHLRNTHRLREVVKRQNTPTAPSTIGQWESIGCYRCVLFCLFSYEHQLVTHRTSDSVNARTLKTGVGVTGPMTAEACVAQCQSDNFPLAGLEFADQCCSLSFCSRENLILTLVCLVCDTAISNGGEPIAANLCNMACQGNSTELCGGPNALNVFNFTGTITGPPTVQPPAGGGGANPVFVVDTPGVLPTGWAYSGCYL